VVGDVSGKGLHAAMTVALIVGAIRSTVEVTTEPAQILSALNRRLHGRLRNGFATCLMMRLNGDGTCVMANAGHLPPYVNGREIPLPGAVPLGLLSEAEYEAVNLRLAPGDCLAVYTDGLLEARNADGELFGFSRISELLARAHDARQIADAAQAFGQDDDITVLTLSFAPVPATVA
jgi:serine phosphatase RsbU (regulator of sigma subunit)